MLYFVAFGPHEGGFGNSSHVFVAESEYEMRMKLKAFLCDPCEQPGLDMYYILEHLKESGYVTIERSDKIMSTPNSANNITYTTKMSFSMREYDCGTDMKPWLYFILKDEGECGGPTTIIHLDTDPNAFKDKYIDVVCSTETFNDSNLALLKESVQDVIDKVPHHSVCKIVSDSMVAEFNTQGEYFCGKIRTKC